MPEKPLTPARELSGRLHVRDTPLPDESDEIEVTPEMVKAGVQVLLDSEGTALSPDYVVRKVYLAATRESALKVTPAMIEAGVTAFYGFDGDLPRYSDPTLRAIVSAVVCAALAKSRCARLGRGIDPMPDDIEITPEMIAAGAKALREWEDSDEPDSRVAVAMIFEAMVLATWNIGWS